MGFGTLLSFIFGLFLLYIVGMLLVIPIKIIVKLIANGVIGGLLLLLFNFIGDFGGAILSDKSNYSVDCGFLRHTRGDIVTYIAEGFMI